jgi:hypothetical protein
MHGISRGFFHEHWIVCNLLIMRSIHDSVIFVEII